MAVDILLNNVIDNQVMSDLPEDNIDQHNDDDGDHVIVSINGRESFQTAARASGGSGGGDESFRYTRLQN